MTSSRPQRHQRMRIALSSLRIGSKRFRTISSRPSNGQQVNNELKHLGHGTDNITKLIGKLVVTSPQQVLQTRKSGNTRQARKTYKVTKAGLKRVQELLDTSS